MGGVVVVLGAAVVVEVVVVERVADVKASSSAGRVCNIGCVEGVLSGALEQPATSRVMTSSGQPRFIVANVAGTAR